MAKRTPKIRHELKYYISMGEYLVLRDRLKPLMPLDPFADQETRSYDIRSLYFDDIYNTAMWEKMYGIKNRKKLRIRIYNYKSDNIKLEKKAKYDMFTAKESSKITRYQVEDIMAGRYDFLISGGNSLFEEMYGDIVANRLKPIVVVDYIREAYTYPAGNVRITFDKYLHSGNFNTDIFRPTMMPVPILDPGTLVLEIKYDTNLPQHIRDIINSTNGIRSAVSKYALCRKYH
jgi:hypothetical protein